MEQRDDQYIHQPSAVTQTTVFTETCRACPFLADQLYLQTF